MVKVHEVVGAILIGVGGACVAGGGCATSPPADPGRTSEAASTPPEGATILFDGGSTAQWVQLRDSGGFAWDLIDGSIVVRGGAGSIRTVGEFQDFTLHVEFLISESAAGETGQGRGNSGVYIQNRYEVQILDSWGDEPLPDGCGALYRRVAASVNASRPAGEWQTYDIEFHAPRFDEAGEKTRNARITVRHNGVLIHDDVELAGKTGAGAAEGPNPGPIVLQDHGNPVRFRNIWIFAE